MYSEPKQSSFRETRTSDSFIAGVELMDEPSYWIDRLLNKCGFDYLCRVDDDYLRDKFNLTGLEKEVPNFKQVYDSLFQVEVPSTDLYETAVHLYGLIHSRFIISTFGLAKMQEKYLSGHYGCCPRLLCKGNRLLPVGISDKFGVSGVKLYCSLCEDIYSPKSSRHSCLDGAYFGTSFPHMFLLTYPAESSSYLFGPTALFGFQLCSAFKSAI